MRPVQRHGIHTQRRRDSASASSIVTSLSDDHVSGRASVVSSMGPSTAFATLSTRPPWQLPSSAGLRGAADEQMFLELVITPPGIQRLHQRGAAAHIRRADGGVRRARCVRCRARRHVRETRAPRDRAPPRRHSGQRLARFIDGQHRDLVGHRIVLGSGATRSGTVRDRRTHHQHVARGGVLDRALHRRRVRSLPGATLMMQAPISTAYSMACARSSACGPAPVVKRTGRMRAPGATPEKRSASLCAAGRNARRMRAGISWLAARTAAGAMSRWMFGPSSGMIDLHARRRRCR